MSTADDICYLSAIDLARAYRDRTLSPVEVVESLLERIDRCNPAINAFVTLTADQARAEARAAERLLMTSPLEALPSLLGIPTTVKDLTPTAGVRTTFGSLHFADNVPTEDGPIWARLKQAGAILLGKTTTPEFGGHTITESPLTGVTSNPWDTKRTTGGSSGGSAAALAAGFGPLSVGSDGGGSIRVPSSLCGVVGLKASVGRIPRHLEMNPYETVGVVGPMTRSVADNALMLSVVAGPHPREAFSLPETGIDYVALTADASVRGLRIAFSTDLGNPPVQREVGQAVRDAADVFASELGALVEEIEIDLPDPMEYFTRWWGPIITAEFEETIGPDGDASLSHDLITSFVTRADTMTARDFARTSMFERASIHDTFADIFDDHELLIWPTTPTTAYAHPGPLGGPEYVAGKRVLEPSLDNQRCTEAIAHAGYPAISVPAGFDADGMPIGLQIAGRHGADAEVLRAARAFEAARPWSHRRPSM